jgi:RimJ/RimL family protein N-acetyltransferase
VLDELCRESYHKATEIFNPLKYHAAIASILSGLTDSRVFVDNRDHPRCALTWTKSRIYLSGELGKDLQRAAATIRDKIRDDTIRRGARRFILYNDTSIPLTGLLQLLDGVKVNPDTRNYYELDAKTREWNEARPDGYRLETIDRRFLNSGYKNLDKVREEMCSERDSVEEFLEKSMGVCGVVGNEVASWCMSEYNHGDGYEIGIATAEIHRRKGLATATADALMKLCLGRRFSHVGWHCWKRNTPSNRTAQRLGFRFVESYPVHVLAAEG